MIDFVTVLGIGLFGYGIISGVYNYKYLSTGAKVILLLLIVSVITEQIATYFAYEFHNTYYVYGIYNPIQLVIISWYYNTTIDRFKINNAGIIIGLTGAVFGIINYLFIQSPKVMNSYFLLTECLIVIAYSLYFFYRLLLGDDDIKLFANPNFWFASLFLFYWTGTFLIWGMYDYLRFNVVGSSSLVHILLLIVSVITYIGFGTVFLLYKKMQTTDGR